MGVRLVERGDRIEATVRWFHARAIVLRGSFAAMSAAVPILVALDLRGAGPTPAGLAFGGVMALTAIALGYETLCRIVNVTRVTAAPEGIAMAHGPLPWLPAPTLRRPEILSFEVLPTETPWAIMPMRRARFRSSGQTAATTREWEDRHRAWSVEAVLAGGGLETIASGLAWRQDAEDLAKILRQWHAG